MSPDGPTAADLRPRGDTDAGASAGAGDAVEALVLPVVAETARIEKRSVETGRVRVSARTEHVDEVLRESLRTDQVTITRVAVERTLAPGEAPPVVREADGVTIVPVLEEILVVEKRLVLKEEVHIRRSRSDEDVEVPVTLRRQRAVVERLSPDGRIMEAADPNDLTDPLSPPTPQETTP